MKLLSEFIWLTVETSGRLFVNTGIMFVFHATWRGIFFFKYQLLASQREIH